MAVGVGSNGGSDPAARADHFAELRVGREKRAADMALKMAQNLERCEKLSHAIPEFERAIQEVCLLVHEATERLKQEIESVVESADKFREIMRDASIAANEFKSMGGKVRELKSEGVLNTDLTVNLHRQLQSIEKVFQKIEARCNAIATTIEPAASKARMQAWLKGK